MADRTEELYKKYYDAGKTQIDEQYSRKKQQDDATIAKMGEVIDNGAQQAGSQYRKRIEEAPVQLREQLDFNDLDERVNRRQLEESMANAGMTDSGLNRTQQTALSIQRGNADAASRKNNAEYVQAAQDAIDQILAEAEQQKAQQELSTRSTTDSWYQNALDNLASGARTAATNDYNAELQAQTEQEKARLEAQTAQYKAMLEAATKQSDNSEARSKYAQALMSSSKGGYSENNAWAAAYARYPTDNEQVNTYYTAYNNAKNSGYSDQQAEVIAGATVNGTDPTDQLAKMKAQEYVGTKNVLKDGNGLDSIVNALFKTGEDDGRYVYEAVGRKLAKDETYNAANKTEKGYIKAIAVGNSLREKFGKNPERLVKMLEAVADNFTDEQYLAMAEAAGI